MVLGDVRVKWRRRIPGNIPGGGLFCVKNWGIVIPVPSDGVDIHCKLLTKPDD